jgi:hypothetical protein
VVGAARMENEKVPPFDLASNSGCLTDSQVDLFHAAVYLTLLL